MAHRYMKIGLASLVLATCFLSSCASPALLTFKRSNDTSAWATENINGLQVRHPRELRVTRLNPTLTAFAISGYEGSRSTDYLGFVMRSGVYVSYPTRKSLEMLRKSVLAQDGKIIGEPKTTGTFQYLFPMSSEIDQKTGKKLIPSVVKVSSFGWFFTTPDGKVCGMHLQKPHDPIEYTKWSPEAVFTAEEIELLDKAIVASSESFTCANTSSLRPLRPFAANHSSPASVIAASSPSATPRPQKRSLT